jgi:phosphatidate cytidylyltransferase
MQRVVSAAVLIAALAVIVWYLPWWSTVILAAVVAAGAGVELAGLAAAGSGAPPAAFAGVTSAAATVAFVFSTVRGAPLGADALAPVLIAGTIASALVVLVRYPPGPATLTNAAVLGLAPLYIGLPLGAAACLQAMFGPNPLGWLIAVIAGSDSAQYYTGRAFGRRKLAPRVSPAKTVEGALGGFVAAAAIGALLAGWGLPGVPVAEAALAALALAGFGIAGDLFESLLKRSAGVKDSSALIPGHGGLLDRIDSYLFALPMFYVFLRYIA